MNDMGLMSNDWGYIIFLAGGAILFCAFMLIYVGAVFGWWPRFW